MADDSDDSADSLSTKVKICDFCETILRNGQKCSLCRVSYIHMRCLCAAAKSGKIVNRKNWVCKTCDSSSGSSFAGGEDVTVTLADDTDNESISDFKKENIMLKTQIAILNKLIKEMENVNKLQKERIEFLENNGKSVNVSPSSADATREMPRVSYSTVAKTSKSMLIVKPANPQKTEETCKQIKQLIDPAALSIKVNNIIPRSNGSIMINCNDAENLNILRENISNKAGKNYRTEIPRKINPKIIIYNVDKDDVSEKEKFCDSLCLQNRIEKSSASCLKVVRVMSRQAKINIIVEADPSTFKQVIGRGFLYVGWRRCQVRESFHIMRCFKCSGYGHLSRDCASEVTCPKCSDGHYLKDCTSEDYKCKNCVDYKNKYKSKLSINHAAFDNSCSCYKRLIDNAKSITMYDF